MVNPTDTYIWHDMTPDPIERFIPRHEMAKPSVGPRGANRKATDKRRAANKAARKARKGHLK